MGTKDYFEILYWGISLAILVFTVYWIAVSPIKAVEIGRRLDNEQNKHKAKSDLFLTLFSLRGSPTHHNYVSSLNQIDIVFEDSHEVLTAWGKLYESLNNPTQNNVHLTWDLLRTELLSEMAQHLGYQKLKQTAIQRNYIPIAHRESEQNYYNQNNSMKEYFESGTKMHNLLVRQYEAQNAQNDA